MATNKVQIQVELKGSEQVNKQLGKIEESAVDLKEGFNGVGESFKSVGDIVRSQGSPMADAFGTLGDSVGAITESVGAFKDGLAVMGETGGKAWVAMLGPLAAVVSGITLAYEAYRQFSGAAQEAEDAAENMAAAAGDTASRLEAMVEAGINLGTEALREYVSINERARLSIEETIKANEKRTLSDQKLKDAIKNLESAETSLLFTDIRVAKAKYDLEQATNQYNIALDKQVQSSIKANEQNKIAFELQELLMKSIVDYQKEEEDQVVRYNDLIERSLSLSNAKNKEQVANKATAQTLTKLYEEQIQLNKVLKVQEDQLKKGIVTQDQYDQSQKAIKQRLKDNTEEMKKQNDQLEIQIKLNEAVSKGANAFKTVGTAIKTGTLSIEDLNREIVLLDRTLQDQKDTLTNYGFEFQETLNKNKESIKGYVNSFNTIKTSATILMDSLDSLQQESLSKNRFAGSDSIFESSALEKALNKINLMTDKTNTAVAKQKQALLKEILDVEQDTAAKLIENEDRKIEILMDIRIKEINEMEISERKKKKLRDEAIKDAAYTYNRLKEITENSIKVETSTIIKGLADTNKLKNDKLLEDKKIAQQEIEYQNNLEKELLRSNMDYFKNIYSISAEYNMRLQVLEYDTFENKIENEKNNRVTERNNLLAYLNEKQTLLESFTSKYTETDREALRTEIEDLKKQIISKDKLNDYLNRSEEIALKSRRKLRRDAAIEMEYQERRNADIYTAIFLDNDQLRKDVEYKQHQQDIRDTEAYLELINRRYEEGLREVVENTAKHYADIERIKNSSFASERWKEISVRSSMAQIEQNKKVEETLLKQKQDGEKKYIDSKKQDMAQSYQYDLDHYQQVGALIKDFSASSAQAFIDAGVAAAFAGESISDAIRTTLRGLAQEATARALFEGAAALGSLAIGDARGAALHGKSAAAFGIAAVGMGALTAAVGVPGGSSGGGGATSPSGMSQTSQAPQREEARQEAMVFNINFGNAVIYDTRAAAERAMAERVMSLGMQARRGYVPPRPRI